MDISEINTDTEDGGRAGTQPSLVSATEVDRSIEAAGGLRQPSQSVTEVPRNLENGMKAKANDLNDKLAANEQMYQGIMKAYTNNLAGDGELLKTMLPVVYIDFVFRRDHRI